MGETMKIVEVVHLSKNFKMPSETVDILEDLSFEIEEGTKVIVTGESGSGKTTLLNLVGGLDSPTAGKILVAGRDICGLDENELSDYRSRITGFIFQFHFLLKDFTALENVMIASTIAGASQKAARTRAKSLLDDVGLAHRFQHYPSELSGGERQRVAVARALMNEPRIVLADEPTGNLDERNSEVVQSLLFDLVSKYGKTLFLVTHDNALARRGDRLYELAHGKLVNQ